MLHLPYPHNTHPVYVFSVFYVLFSCKKEYLSDYSRQIFLSNHIRFLFVRLAPYLKIHIGIHAALRSFLQCKAPIRFLLLSYSVISPVCKRDRTIWGFLPPGYVQRYSQWKKQSAHYYDKPESIYARPKAYISQCSMT